LKNEKTYLTWTLSEIACLLMRQDSICIQSEVTVALEKARQPKSFYPQQKKITITILGAISQAWVIDISSNKPQVVSTFKEKSE
jgi:hypothetical protein